MLIFSPGSTIAPRARGFSLIEILVAMAIFGILLAIAIPSYQTWIKSNQIRIAAEQLQASLRHARALAISQNIPIRVSLVDSLSDECELSPTPVAMIISVDNPVGECNATVLGPNANLGTAVAPRIVSRWSASSGGGSATFVVPADTSIVFNPLGRANAAVNIRVENPSGGICGGDLDHMRCLEVRVSVGGQVRVCDPALANPDPANWRAGAC